MKYILSERVPGEDRTAWSKARLDAETIAQRAGFTPLIVEGVGGRGEANRLGKAKGHLEMGRRWQAAFAQVPDGATVLVQLPLVNNAVVLPRLIRRATARKIEVVGLIHDLEALRMMKDPSVTQTTRLRMRVEELGALKACSRLIVHNVQMGEVLTDQGLTTPHTILGIFDYLLDERPDGRSWAQANATDDTTSLVFAGNLSPEKSGFLYDPPAGVELELYGGRYENSASQQVHYHGSFPAAVLHEQLVGGWGLVWDGPNPLTCEGPYGAYLRYNNPHKLSLFLAAGFPVVVWDEMALASLVTEHGLGITVASLADVPAAVAALSHGQYQQLMANVAQFGQHLRQGEFLRAALDGHTLVPAR
ncbi:MAG: hypothetical protein ACRCWS_00140 [Propionibacteriaceae bacterium]